MLLGIQFQKVSCCNILFCRSLSDNNLQDDGIGHVVELFTKLPNLSSVK